MQNDEVKLVKGSCFIGRWNYIKPTYCADKDGDIVLVLQLSFGPCEWWKWGIDSQGKFFMEYRWCENDFYEDESFREEISKEALLERLQYMQKLLIEHGLQEQAELYVGAENFVVEKY